MKLKLIETKEMQALNRLKNLKGKTARELYDEIAERNELKPYLISWKQNN